MESQFHPKLRSEREREKQKTKKPLSAVTEKELMKKPIQLNIHFFLRIRELQKIHGVEDLIEKDNSLIRRESILNRINNKLCVVSGKPLESDSTISNYGDEGLEKLYLTIIASKDGKISPETVSLDTPLVDSERFGTKSHEPTENGFIQVNYFDVAWSWKGERAVVENFPEKPFENDVFAAAKEYNVKYSYTQHPDDFKKCKEQWMQNLFASPLQ